MGASGNNMKNMKNSKSFIMSLFISFTKIKNFASQFQLDNKGEFENLSKVFFSLLIHHFIKPYEDHLEKMIEIEKGNINNLESNEILEFILVKLHEEFNLNKGEKNKIQSEFNTIEELDEYVANNNSFILNLFSGIKEKNFICQNCSKDYKKYDIFLFEYDDFFLKTNDIRELIKMGRTENIKCKFCEKENKMKSTIIESPEILIVAFNKNKIRDCYIKYYLNCDFNDEKYTLLGFISQKDENNGKVDNYNIFYQDDGKWYIYKVEEMIKKQIPKITEITGNPLVTFYKQIWPEEIFNKLSALINDKTLLTEQINQHITDFDKFDNYYVFDRKWYNKLLKIYESDEIYDNDDIIINFNKDLTNIFAIKSSELKEKKRNFIKNKKFLFETESCEPKFEEIEIEKKKIKYPKDIMLINKNVFDDLLESLLKANILFKELIYPVKLGENYVFIKYKDEEIYLVYSFEYKNLI